MKKSKKKKQHKKLLILLLLLLIVLIFSCIYFSFSNINKPDLNINIDSNKKPVIDIEDKTTKPVVIEDIDITSTQETTQKKTTYKKNEAIESNKNIITPKQEKKTTTKKQNPTATTEPIIDEGIFSVRDSKDKWSTTSELKIFDKTQQKLAVNGKIAPGFSDKYIFTIRNNNDFDIKTSIDFIEENTDQINIKYRIKKGISYIIGDSNTWLSSNELIIKPYKMKTKTKDTYTLEWKWFEGPQDTEIGLRGNIKYKIDINIVVEGIE